MPPRLWAGLLCLFAALSVQAQQRVSFPSLDKSDGKPVPLVAFWLPAEAAVPAPAIVMLHGCGGPYASNGAAKGRLNERMRDYAALFNQQGWHALVVDSLSPRGEKELCTQRTGTRKVTQTQRRRDAQAAMAWLASRADVDRQRIGLLGWSNGASTVLATTNLRHREVVARKQRPAFAVAFYPGCEAELRRGYEGAAPLLMLVGEDDDWTPAAPCRQLAGQAAGLKPEIVAYAGAHHGFDSTAPLRLRKEVPNGVHPGRGVHVGGHPEARAASREKLLAFLRERLG
jgi:dienelactone hydrolase